MNKRFPSIYKALGDDKMRPAMQYAIIEDGKIVATNGKILVVSDFSVFAGNSELAENKVFDKDLLRWMAKKDFKQLECTGTGIVARKPNGEKEEMLYPGYYRPEEKTARAICLYPDKNRQIGNFPNWKAVIPSDLQYAESEKRRQTGLDANLLSIAIDSFAFGEEQPVLKFEFSGTEKNSPVRITPLFDRDDRPGRQCVYLMSRITQD